MAMPVTDPTTRFFAKIVTNGDDDCWTWEGAKISSGYGHLRGRSQSETILAHRLAYEMFIGPIPADTEVDHICHNADKACAGGRTCPHRACVNPGHLEAVTQSVNAKRGRTGEHMRRG